MLQWNIEIDFTIFPTITFRSGSCFHTHAIASKWFYIHFDRVSILRSACNQFCWSKTFCLFNLVEKRAKQTDAQKTGQNTSHWVKSDVNERQNENMCIQLDSRVPSNGRSIEIFGFAGPYLQFIQSVPTSLSPPLSLMCWVTRMRYNEIPISSIHACIWTPYEMWMKAVVMQQSEV